MITIYLPMQLGGNYTLNFDKLKADDDGLKNGFNDRFLSLQTIFEHFLALALFLLRRILPVCTAHCKQHT